MAHPRARSINCAHACQRAKAHNGQHARKFNEQHAATRTPRIPRLRLPTKSCRRKPPSVLPNSRNSCRCPPAPPDAQRCNTIHLYLPCAIQASHSCNSHTPTRSNIMLLHIIDAQSDKRVTREKRLLRETRRRRACRSGQGRQAHHCDQVARHVLAACGWLSAATARWHSITRAAVQHAAAKSNGITTCAPHQLQSAVLDLHADSFKAELNDAQHVAHRALLRAWPPI